MKLGIVGSRGLNSNDVFEVIGNYIHSMETEDQVVDTIIVGGETNGSDGGAREFATNFGFRYQLIQVDTRNDGGKGTPSSVVEGSDALLAIWDGQTYGKTWNAIKHAIRKNIPFTIVGTQKVRVNQ